MSDLKKMESKGDSPARGHNFEIHSYGLTPTQCFICNEFLNGFWQEAYQCQNCAINVHDTCRSQCSSQCFVTHRFKETSYMTIATCAACGQAMIGLWKQGFKCEDCGLDVHPQCRTQSSISACRAAAPLHIPLVPTGDAVQLPHASDQPKRRSFLERSSSHRLMTENSSSKSLLPLEPLPTDLEGVKKEMKKLHDECLESSRALDDRWEKSTKPSLKAQRTQYQQQYEALKMKQKEKQSEVIALSTQRDDALKTFLKAFYSKYNQSKIKNVEQVVSHYANGTCREREFFSDLLEKYTGEPTAVAMIEHERDYGLMSQGALEQAIIESEELASQVTKSKRALEAVRQEVHFAPNVPWLVKGGAEGVYVGFTSVWLEECIGMFNLKCAVVKAEPLAPLQGDDDGYRPRISMSLMGLNASNPGWQLSARLEDMCLQGSGLPVSLSLRDADILMAFDLSMDVQYEPSTGPEDPDGHWRVLDAGFILKAHRFTLKTKNTGGLTIPDVVLSTILQNVIAMIFKKVIILALPPEIGMYMMAVHLHRVNRRKHHTDEVDPDNIWQSPSSADPFEDRFLKLKAKINIKQTIELDAVDAFITERSMDSSLASKVFETLQLDKEQFRLLLQTQKELGVTWGALWGAQSTDWLSTIATTVTGSGPDLGRIPLQSLLDLVKYHRDFLDPNNLSNGMTRQRKIFVAQRLKDLWQLGSDLVCENSGGEGFENGGITGKMKRMVTQRLRKEGPSVRAIEWPALVARVAQLAKQEIHTEVEVPDFEITIAVRGLIRCLRDAALRFIGKKAGGVHARVAVLPKKLPSSAPSNGPDGIGKVFATAVEQDRAQNKNSLVPDFGKSLPVKVQRASDFLLEKLRELQERYVESYHSRVELVAGDGAYRGATTDARFVAPVDVSLQLGGDLFSSLFSRTVKSGSEMEANKWPWNRKVTIDDGLIKFTNTRDYSAATSTKDGAKDIHKGGVIETLKRMGGKAAQAAEKDTGYFSYAYSGLFAQMRTETSAASDVLSFQIRPLSDPDRVEIKAVGAGAMRLHVSIDKIQSSGQFATLFHYVDDMIAFAAKKTPELQRLRVLSKFVASFAALDSFYIDTLSHIVLRSEKSAGDLVAHVENHQGQRCLRLELVHYALDVIHDLLDLLEAATKFSPKEKA